MKGISNNLAKGPQRYQGLKGQSQVNKNRKMLNVALTGKNLSIGSNADVGPIVKKSVDYGGQALVGPGQSHERSVSVDQRQSRLTALN